MGRLFLFLVFLEVGVFNSEAERAKQNAIMRMLNLCDQIARDLGKSINKKRVNEALLASSQYRAAVGARNVEAQVGGPNPER